MWQRRRIAKKLRKELLGDIEFLVEAKLERERLFREDFSHRTGSELLAKIDDLFRRRLSTLPISFPQDGKVLIHTIDGHRLYLDPNEPFMTLHLIEHGQWEVHVRDALRTILEPASVFIDVGANTGVHALLAASLVGPEGKVLAIEPHPITRTFLHDNLEINGLLDRVDVISAAIGDVNAEQMDFEYFVDHPAMSGFKVHRERIMQFEGKVEKIKVESKTMDSLVSGLGLMPDLIKIDVEGFENNVIRGSINTIDQCPDTMFLIEHERSLANDVCSGDATEQLFEVFFNRGFEAIRLADNEASKLIEHGEIKNYSFGDYLFLRPTAKQYRKAKARILD